MATAAPDAAVTQAPSLATTGLALVERGEEALALRAALARTARSSLDLQYYAWHGDRSGSFLAAEALAAADRGVTVRLLLDDAFAIGHDRVLSALDDHPNITVRLFNGTRWRRFGRLGLALELLLGSWHLNRRMHNKAWIADGTRAVLGGRNIGDAYFDAGAEFDFRDLDLVIAGPEAAAAATIFERYWTSRLARPAGEASTARDAMGGLRTLRTELAATEPPVTVPDAEALDIWLGARLEPVPTGAVRIVADPPEKARRGLRARRLARAAGGLNPDVVAGLRRARQEALLVSPYFVPGRAGLALLRELAARGVAVSVVTNSLVATDVVAVHGGYARYRRALLSAGIALYELKRRGHQQSSIFGSKGASLHTKAFVVDDARICVGSFNLDPRSVLLNTEMAVFVDSPRLARSLRLEHARLTSPAHSWRVTHDGVGLCWEDHDAAGRPRCRRTEPDASWRRRLVAALTRLLPIENQL